MAGPDRPQMTMRCMRFEYWKTKDKDTHSEYVIFIAFPRQQWLLLRRLNVTLRYIASLFYALLTTNPIS